MTFIMLLIAPGWLFTAFTPHIFSPEITPLPNPKSKSIFGNRHVASSSGGSTAPVHGHSAAPPRRRRRQPCLTPPPTGNRQLHAATPEGSCLPQGLYLGPVECLDPYHNPMNCNMSVSTLTPKFVISNTALSPHLPKKSTHVRGFQPKHRFRPHFPIRSNTFKTYAVLAEADPFVLEIAETLEDSVSSLSLSSSAAPPPLQKLRDVSSESLVSLKWPSRKDEAFRFTDVSFLRSSRIHPSANPPLEKDISRISADDQVPDIIIVDGYVVTSLSKLSTLPDGVFAGSISNLSSETALQKVHQYLSSSKEDLFWSLNGVGTPDLTVIYVPEGCRLETPLHLRYYSGEGSDVGSNKLPISNPRVLVLVEKGGEVGIIEEYLSEDGNKIYWANSVMEVVLEQGATLNHSYIQCQSSEAAHTKWTSVRQEATSTYKLIEISCGGKVSRHNLDIEQLGPETITDLSTLHLSLGHQTQDLHSRVILEHPGGYSRQLHKCIVAHPQGHAVFDGNVKVNKFAQRTDAGQLTRSLLLAPRATVNVKPNLQIIADDVKCSHGATISDLEEEDQLLYFRARGIDAATARKALVFSFGAEVIQRIPFPLMREKAKKLISNLLSS